MLAYGQTGSGKTHTMGGGWGEHSGTADEVGIIPRVIGELFGGIEEARERFVFVVRVSYLEVCAFVIELSYFGFPVRGRHSGFFIHFGQTLSFLTRNLAPDTCPPSPYLNTPSLVVHGGFLFLPTAFPALFCSVVIIPRFHIHHTKCLH